MSENNRVIKINTDLFKIPHMTRKNRKPPTNKIRVKSQAKEQNNATLKKKLMKFIRNQHDQKAKESVKPSLETEFKSEFKESLDYLSKISTNNVVTAHNRTLKSPMPKSVFVPLPTNLPMSVHTHLPISMPTNLPVTLPMSMPTNLPVPLPMSMPTSMSMPAYTPTPMSMLKTPAPEYGCLKGGKLPLYKHWNNQTYKTNAIPPILKPMKQKRTIRRTFKTGRSKVAPKVSVLISNRTIRNHISTKTQLMKQTPIGEVKKFLIKGGFIKIGSIAPNDVLRKMYEAATLVCGEVTNHNPDNLLYNFVNGQN